MTTVWVLMMNENEYIFTTEQTHPVSEIVSDIETSVTSAETSVSADYDFTHIQQNTDGIFLMTSGIFFLLVIYLIGKFLGNFLSM